MKFCIKLHSIVPAHTTYSVNVRSSIIPNDSKNNRFKLNLKFNNALGDTVLLEMRLASCRRDYSNAIHRCRGHAAIFVHTT